MNMNGFVRNEVFFMRDYKSEFEKRVKFIKSVIESTEKGKRQKIIILSIFVHKFRLVHYCNLEGFPSLLNVLHF